MPDPFDLSQYVTSFQKVSQYTPQSFQFADFDNIFAQITEAIKMRQAGVSIGFAIPENAFINIESYDTTSPIGLSDSIDRFQDALRELVRGSLIEEYGKLPNCDIYVGFFHYESGLPIIEVYNIAPNGIDFTPPPDPNTVNNVIDFAKAIGSRINEIIYALNILRYLHAKMYFAYPLDVNCESGSSPDDPCPPSNDNCAGTTLDVANRESQGPPSDLRCINGSTICATIDRNIFPNLDAPNVWYNFTVPGSGQQGDYLADDYFAINFYIRKPDGSIDDSWLLNGSDVGVNGNCDDIQPALQNGEGSFSFCVKRNHRYIFSVWKDTPLAEGNFTLCWYVEACFPIDPVSSPPPLSSTVSSPPPFSSPPPASSKDHSSSSVDISNPTTSLDYSSYVDDSIPPFPSSPDPSSSPASSNPSSVSNSSPSPSSSPGGSVVTLITTFGGNKNEGVGRLIGSLNGEFTNL